MKIIAHVITAMLVVFLTCDPYPNSSSQPTEFVVTEGTIENVSPAHANPDGSVTLMYELTGYTDGTHSITVKARNPWGESVTVPFVFTKELPGTPGGLRLSISD